MGEISKEVLRDVFQSFDIEINVPDKEAWVLPMNL